MVVAVQEADGVGGKGAVGIVPLGVALQVDALEGLASGIAGLGNEFPDLVAHGVPVRLGLEHLIPAFRLLHPLADFLLADVQQLRQLLRNHVLVLLPCHGQRLPALHPFRQLFGPVQVHLCGVVLDRLGVQEHGVRHGGDSQNGAVAVVDGPP